jgi:uncharacterized membrane protein (UPF0136 family)
VEPLKVLHDIHDYFAYTLDFQYGLGGYRMANRQSYGVELALLASLLLAGSSIPRALKSGKPLPTGLSVLAIYGLIQFTIAYTNRGY